MEDNPYKAPTIQSTGEKRPARPPWQWRLYPAGLFLAYCLLQLAQMTPNSSFEHHPFSGGLILLHTSSSVDEYLISTGICLALLLGIFSFVIWPKVLTVLMSIASLAAWLTLSIKLAAWASC